MPVKVNGSQRAVAARSHGTLASDFNDAYVPGGNGGRGSRGECDLRIRVIRHPERSHHHHFDFRPDDYRKLKSIPLFIRLIDISGSGNHEWSEIRAVYDIRPERTKVLKMHGNR